MYRADGMQLNCIQTIRQGGRNDIYICQDEASEDKKRYVVLAVNDHELTRQFLDVCEVGGNETRSFLVSQVSAGRQQLLVFPYVKERRLKDFYMGELLELTECESICSSLVLCCIQSQLPYPLLYLVLKQNRVNLAKEGSVYIDYELELDELDPTKTEKDCVILCARMLLDMLSSKAAQKADSFALLSKRTASSGYRLFAEIYKDISISSAPKSRFGFINRIKVMFRSYKDVIFRVFLILCILLGIFTVATILCQLIFGDVPWLGFFTNNFKQIGTENLVQ